jgi:hypothetical protein
MSSAGQPTIDAASTRSPSPRMTDACCWAPASSVLLLNRLRGRSDGLKAERVRMPARSRCRRCARDAGGRPEAL